MTIYLTCLCDCSAIVRKLVLQVQLLFIILNQSIMKKSFFALAILMLPFTMQAQLGGVLNKAKAKLQQRVDSKTDKAIDKTLDAAENSAKGKNAQPANEAGENASAGETENSGETKPGLVSYSKFDFVPGDKVLYAEDFAQDNIGELPMAWNSSGKGEVMTIEGKEGKWVRGYQNNTLLSGNTQKFGDNYTVEFDLIYYFNPKVTGYVLPDVKFGMFSSKEKESTDNEFLDNHYVNNEVRFLIDAGNGTAYAQSYYRGGQTFRSDAMNLPGFTTSMNKPMHYSIQVQKTRARMWLNAAKIFDIPRAVNVSDTLNQLFFDMGNSNYKDDEIGYFLTNIKVATGLPDTRHKLMEEGKFSTTGILFGFQSASIKPESFGVIKEIANVMKENPGVNIKVVGHTSSDGDLAANMKLSDMRAAAVKEVLIKEFGVEEARLSTEGKGPKEPVADNKTPEGKAQNRRVEFIKL